MNTNYETVNIFTVSASLMINVNIVCTVCFMFIFVHFYFLKLFLVPWVREHAYLYCFESKGGGVRVSSITFQDFILVALVPWMREQAYR